MTLLLQNMKSKKYNEHKAYKTDEITGYVQDPFSREGS